MSTTRRRSPEEEERDRRERLAYLGAPAAGLVHEVRTPLHAIQLNAQMLSEDAERLPETVRPRFLRRCKRVYSEVRELTRILEAFLVFARPPKLDPTPTDLNQFLRELLEFVQPEMDEAGVRLTAGLARDMYPVVLDQRQFTHVMLNLLRNAKEAIDQRREREAEDFEGCVHLATRDDGNTIVLTVRDNGLGIEPGEEERIFEVFFTTKPKGTGLGLGIVRRIVEDHRGTIAADPVPPPGAQFTITLPRGHFLEYAPPGAVPEAPPPAT